MRKSGLLLLGCLLSCVSFAGSLAKTTSFPVPSDRGYRCGSSVVNAKPGQFCLSTSNTKSIQLQWSVKCSPKGGSGTAVSNKVTCDGQSHVVFESPVITKQYDGSPIPAVGDSGFAIVYQLSNRLLANANNPVITVKINNCVLPLIPNPQSDGTWAIPASYTGKIFDCSGNSSSFDIVPNPWHSTN